MKSKFLQYLFNESQQRSDLDSIADALVGIFEDADQVEELTSKKKPLIKALNDLGIEAKDEHISVEVGGISLTTDDEEGYAKAKTVLQSPTGMHEFAQAGWIATFVGDDSADEPNYRINFIELDTEEEDSKDKAEDLETLIKKSAVPVAPVDEPKVESAELDVNGLVEKLLS